jgi:CBS domain-containing protein
MSNKKSLLSVDQVMLDISEIACVRKDTFLKATIECMSKTALGIAFILDDEGCLFGVFTDGDIRRMILKYQKPISALFVDDISVHCNTNPASININTNLLDAIKIMEDKGICDLPVVKDKNKLCGLVHLHPAIKKIIK